MLVTSISCNELALAHQAADTLKTIIADWDLIQRVSPHISDLILYIIDCFQKVNIPNFFDFVEEVIKFYQGSISVEQYQNLLKAMVGWLVNETNDCIQNQFWTNMAI